MGGSASAFYYIFFIIFFRLVYLFILVIYISRRSELSCRSLCVRWSETLRLKRNENEILKSGETYNGWVLLIRHFSRVTLPLTMSCCWLIAQNSITSWLMAVWWFYFKTFCHIETWRLLECSTLLPLDLMQPIYVVGELEKLIQNHYVLYTLNCWQRKFHFVRRRELNSSDYFLILSLHSTNPSSLLGNSRAFQQLFRSLLLVVILPW